MSETIKQMLVFFGSLLTGWGMLGLADIVNGLAEQWELIYTSATFLFTVVMALITDFKKLRGKSNQPIIK